jgi:hypothetical protein
VAIWQPAGNKNACPKLASDTTPMQTKYVTRAGKVRLMTLDHLDRRTAAAERAIALAEAFAAELGDLTPMQRIRVETAAALSAIAEDAQTRRLAGDSSITLDDLVRAVSAARRAVRDLGIDDRKHEPPGPTLGDILRQGIDRQREREDAAS